MTAFGHFKLSKKQAPKTEASRRRMAKVLYASVVGSVMYTMATLWFNRKEVVLEGFFDSDYGGCLDSGKSTTEAEYMAIAEAGKELNRLGTIKEHFTQCHDVIHGSKFSGFSWNATTQFIEAEEEVEVCTEKEVVTTVPEEFQEGQPMEQPLSICNSCMVLQNGIPV
ncbi:hypothetical protein Tco_0355782 [Tanacetum coccineum]